MSEKNENRQGVERIVLYQPESSKMKECKKWLNVYTLYALLPKYRQLKSLLEEKVLYGKIDLPSNLLTVLRKKGNLPKGDLVDFLAFFIADSRNFRVYFQMLPSIQQMAWRLLFKNYFADEKLLRRTTGVSWITRSKKYFGSYDINLVQEAPWFEVLRVYRSYPLDDEHYLYIPRFLRVFLYPFFFSEISENTVDLVADLPEREGLHIFNDESALFGLLPVLDAYYRQNLLDVGKNGRLGIASLNKLGKMLNLKEFFPESPDKTAAGLRRFMLLNSYAKYRSYAKLDDRPELVVKNWMNSLFSDQMFLLAIVLPHVNGIRQTMMMDTNAHELALSVLEVLGSLDSVGWISVDFLRLQLNFSERNSGYALLFNNYVLEKASFVNNKQGKELITLDCLFDEVSVPFIKGFLFGLASLALVEIAYKDYDPDSCSYCDSLRFVRLTPLGRYVLGLAKMYVPKLEEEVGFELDEDNLIVRSTCDSNLYESLLADIADPIGWHRYKVSFGSFLKNCSNASDVEKKINFFHQYVCKCPPRNWSDFFSALLSRNQSFQKKSSQEYVIYRLDAKDSELLRLVSSDAYLRRYTLRAESYLLLVDSAHLLEVKVRLKKFGYLL